MYAKIILHISDFNIEGSAKIIESKNRGSKWSLLTKQDIREEVRNYIESIRKIYMQNPTFELIEVWHTNQGEFEAYFKE